MANDKSIDQKSDNAGEGASRADVAKAVASGIDAVFGPGFAQQLQEQAKARGASPTESENALSDFAGNLSDSDKQGLILSQSSEFNQKMDDEINAKLVSAGLLSQDGLQGLIERLKAKSGTGDATPPTSQPSPRKPGA